MQTLCLFFLCVSPIYHYNKVNFNFKLICVFPKLSVYCYVLLWCALFQVLTLTPPKSHHDLPRIVYFSSVCVSIVNKAIIFHTHGAQIWHSRVYMMSLEPCFRFAIIRLTNRLWKQMQRQRMTFAAATLGCRKGQTTVWPDSGYLQWYSTLGYATLCSFTRELCKHWAMQGLQQDANALSCAKITCSKKDTQCMCRYYHLLNAATRGFSDWSVSPTDSLERTDLCNVTGKLGFSHMCTQNHTHPYTKHRNQTRDSQYSDIYIYITVESMAVRIWFMGWAKQVTAIDL